VKKLLSKIKRKAIAIWMRFKAWVIGLLVAIGLVATPLLAIETTFTYTRGTEYSDQTPMPLAEIAETKLYCNGSLVVTELGADENFNPDLTPGSYDCYATHVDVYGRESIPSNTVTKVVLPGLPNPPILD